MANVIYVHMKYFVDKNSKVPLFELNYKIEEKISLEWQVGINAYAMYVK